MPENSEDVTVFDVKLLMQKRQRIQANFSAFDFLYNEAAERLADRLLDIQKGFSKILILGHNINYLSGLVKAKVKNNAVVVECDYRDGSEAEYLGYDEVEFDCVISHLNLHHINDVPGVLAQVKRILKPDGLFLASLFGGETLLELRESLMTAEVEISGGASPRVSPFIDVRDAGALLQRAGFSIPVVDSDLITVTYDHIFKLMHDLRGMAETNILCNRLRSFTRRDIFMRAGEVYHEKYAEIGARIPVRFDLIFLTGWTPHENQQKPLQPGSAKNNLVDVLQSVEQTRDE